MSFEVSPAEIEVIEFDTRYIEVYLMDRDLTTGVISPYDLSNAISVVFKLRRYNYSVNTLEANMVVVDAKRGLVRCLATIPSAGCYYSQIQVNDGGLIITWEGPKLIVKPRL